jgi:hypothetical protein
MNAELRRLLTSGYFTEGGVRRSKDQASNHAKRRRATGYNARVITIKTRAGEAEYFVMIRPKIR